MSCILLWSWLWFWWSCRVKVKSISSQTHYRRILPRVGSNLYQCFNFFFIFFSFLWFESFSFSHEYANSCNIKGSNHFDGVTSIANASILHNLKHFYSFLMLSILGHKEYRFQYCTCLKKLGTAHAEALWVGKLKDFLNLTPRKADYWLARHLLNICFLHEQYA